MTTKEFIELYDNKHIFNEYELHDMFWGDFEDDDDVFEVETLTGESDRWTHPVDKVYKIQGRYFMFYADIANTEYQEDYFEIQPCEVKPVEKTIIGWEEI